MLQKQECGSQGQEQKRNLKAREMRRDSGGGRRGVACSPRLNSVTRAAVHPRNLPLLVASQEERPSGTLQEQISEHIWRRGSAESVPASCDSYEGAPLSKVVPSRKFSQVIFDKEAENTWGKDTLFNK